MSFLRPNSTPPLPFDIWHEILGHLTAFYAAPYDLSAPHTFTMQRSALSWENGDPLRKEWLRLRLVCRAWSNWSWVPFKSFGPSNNDVRPTKNTISWVHISATEVTITRLCEFIVGEFQVTSHLTTLSISSWHDEDVLRVLEVGRFLPCVKNLSIRARCRVRTLWSRLDAGFPNLTVLRLCDVRPGFADRWYPGLRSIQYLELDNYSSVSPLRTHFASLKHIVARRCSCDLYRLISAHSHQLVSLSLDNMSATAMIPVPIWPLICWIEVLELPAHFILESPLFPTSRDPMQHLIFEQNTLSMSSAKRIVQFLSRPRGVNKVTIDATGWSYWERTCLRAICKHRGIELILLSTQRDPGLSVGRVINNLVLRTVAHVRVRWL